jgi:hypothetical protein
MRLFGMEQVNSNKEKKEIGTVIIRVYWTYLRGMDGILIFDFFL